MTKDFENALKKLRVSYRREVNELPTYNEAPLYSEQSSSSILESSISFDEESKEDDVPLLVKG